MIEDPPRECPFCDFVPDVAKTDVKTAPEMEVREVYLHVGMEHREEAEELPPHGVGE